MADQKTCLKCGQIGHTSSSCPKWKLGVPFALACGDQMQRNAYLMSTPFEFWTRAWSSMIPK